jgi:Xaa-Pro aminopeptidase
MLETTLLTGPYDWDPALTPQTEFDARIAAVRDVMRRRNLDGVFVGGTSPEHGALGYLTGFVPKLGPALAFIPAAGDLRLAFSGGGAMLTSAQRLTFIAKIHASRDSQHDCTTWIAEAGGTRFGLWADYAITKDVRDSIDRAVPSPVAVLDGELDALRRRKSDGELVLVRRACSALDITMRALRGAIASGAGVRAAALAAEREGYAKGAQDVRILLGARDGGMPQPLIGAADPKVDPLLAAIAVRCAGYWAEGLATLTARPAAMLTAAEAALEAILKAARPGAAATALAAAAQHLGAAYKTHPLVASSIGNGIGMSREEAPFLAANSSDVLRDGDVCTVRAGVESEGSGGALVSAMIRIGRFGAQVLWR